MVLVSHSEGHPAHPVWPSLGPPEDLDVHETLLQGLVDVLQDVSPWVEDQLGSSNR